MVKDKDKKNRNDKNRFVLSKATQQEFGLKDRDVPPSMRPVLDQALQYTNHVDQNIGSSRGSTISIKSFIFPK